jgi:acyl-CoA thioesterase I
MSFASSVIRSFAYGATRLLCNCAIPLIFVGSIANAETVKIVALGDSLTAGLGLPQDQGLVPQLQAWLTAQGQDVLVENAGVSGDTTAGGLARVEWALGSSPDAMIVTLGGNDMLRGIDPAEAKSNLDGILKAAQSRNLPVLLVGLKAPGNYGPDYKTDFDAMYPDLATQYDALLVDSFFAPIFTDTSQRLNPDLMQADGIHPNAKGVAAVVGMIGPQVVELVAKVGL